MAKADTTPSTGVPQLTAFQRDTLFVLAGVGPAHGLAIKHGLEDYLGTEVNHGRLYPNLDTLADRGLVDKRDGKDKRSNEYEITERGAAELQDRREWERGNLEGVSA